MAKSIVDYIFRWLDSTFPGGKRVPAYGKSSVQPDEVAAVPVAATKTEKSNDRVDKQFEGFMEDAPACDVCGAITVRNGACYKCFNCGNSMGCS